MADRHILATAVHAFLSELNAESLREVLDRGERPWREYVYITDDGLEVGGTPMPAKPISEETPAEAAE